MDGGTLSEEPQVERLGMALLKLNHRMDELKGIFGLTDEDLNIDLGPLDRLGDRRGRTPNSRRLHARASVSPSRTHGLVDILDRVLDKGLVIAGDIKINLANVELLTIQVRLLICSIDHKAEQIGLNW